MAQKSLAPEALSSNVRIIAGQHTTVAAADALTIPGISTIISAVVSYGTDPADANTYASCTFTGAVLTIKTWKQSGTDPTPVAADAFSKLVNYIVVGY